MYNLDINFLNDRPDLLEREVRRQDAPTQNIDQTPILIGAGVALALNAIVGGAWFIFHQQNTDLTKERDALVATLGQKTSEVEALDKINAETAQANKEADALATVFNQIKPWSALTLELGELMQVAGVRILNIEQTEPDTATAAAPAPSPSPAADQAAAPPPEPKTAQLKISGVANTYTQINDFVLLLNQSPFFNGEKTKLIEAKLEENPTQLVAKSPDADSGTAKPQLQPVVKYTIETYLSLATASELLPQLQKNGALGLVNRIKTLEEKGVIKK
ncbi:PilN domain-containing protein [Planktothrix sp. FACHB-1365]|uniref:PilN domain-containing protein n=1 Tax=Planktothrix sp. FACHB-1365 TaxID=2692855 RepID=UPI001681F066|nr:PilN domain-containing protein [Planktothrix sp. FACHB-1365]MBD2485155.1 PilN domain-containing protein [Planktothrix sp. FACHB-1365]